LKSFVAKQTTDLKPKLSIVVVPRIFPNRQLDSFLQSTKCLATGYEVIIVTSKISQDLGHKYAEETLKVSPTLVQTVVASLDSDPGLASGRNIGAFLATSKNLFFCDDDITLTQDISPLLNWLENDGCQSIQPMILRFPDSSVIDSAGDSLLRLRGIYHAQIRGANQNLNQQIQQLAAEQMPSLRGAFMAVNKDALVAIGGFDDSFCFNFDDVDLGWRMTLAGYRNIFTPAITVLHLGGRTTNLTLTDHSRERYHLVNHHAMQLKVSSLAAWPFIIARFNVFTVKHALKHCRNQNNAVEFFLKETVALHKMLFKRLSNILEHRRILKNKFHYAGRDTFRAMVNQKQRFPAVS
jgi:GT2 family glycosyltransferase